MTLVNKLKEILPKAASIGLTEYAIYINLERGNNYQVSIDKIDNTVYFGTIHSASAIGKVTNNEYAKLYEEANLVKKKLSEQKIAALTQEFYNL